MIISIRNARHAKTGLWDMIDYMNQFIEVEESEIVEIGVYVGDATEIFAKKFKHVYAIDPFENGYDDNDNASHQHDMRIIEKQFNDLIMEVYDNIGFSKRKSLDMVGSFIDKYIDVVYIDGEHTYKAVKEDINAWLPKIRKGGFLCGHDYQPRFQGTIDAVNEFKEPDRIFLDTSWVIRI